VVQPGAEDLQGPQFAPVLVMDDVVGIVGAGILVVEGTHGATIQKAAGQSLVSIAKDRARGCQHRIQVRRGQSQGLAAAQIEGNFFLHHQIVTRELHHPVHRGRETNGVEDEIPHHPGPDGHARMSRWVEFQQPDITPRVLDAEAGRHAAYLGSHDAPGLGAVGTAVQVRTQGRALHQFLVRQHTHAHAVGEPARIDHLVQGVHIHGRAAGVAVVEVATDAAGMEEAREGTGHETVEGIGDVTFLHEFRHGDGLLVVGVPDRGLVPQGLILRSGTYAGTARRKSQHQPRHQAQATGIV